MDEKKMYLQMRAQEFETTKRVLRSFPEDKLDLKPSEKSMTAKHLVWIFANEERLLPKLVFGEMPDFSDQHTGTVAEAIAEYEDEYHKLTKLLDSVTDAQLRETTKFYVAPKTMGDVPKMSVLWMLLHDQIHHRGQLSVYLRLAGAKVPSIYGPSADEPWM